MTTLTTHPTRSGFNHIVAFEVAKAELVVHCLPAGTTTRLANTRKAIRRLLKAEMKRNGADELGPLLVVCEATGGYERAVIEEAARIDLACHRAHGSAVSAYARFSGTHAKSDPIDARMLAGYGRDKADLRLHRPPRPEQAALRELTARRADLIQMIGAERCRLEQARLDTVVKSIKAHLAALEKERARIEAGIAALMAADADFAAKSRLMQSFAGVGPVTAHTLLAYLPEIGQVPRGTLAALAGLAPYDRDSGTASGPRRIFAGRAEVRTCLRMAAVSAMRCNPVMRTFAARLTRTGKPFGVVATAVMRKIITILNAIIAQKQPWQGAQIACIPIR